MIRRFLSRPALIALLGAAGFLCWLVPALIQGFRYYGDWGTPGRNPHGYIVADAIIAAAVLAAGASMIMLGRRAARYVAWVTAGAALVSLAATVYALAVLRHAGLGSLLLELEPLEIAEAVGLVVLLVPAVRWLPARVAVPVAVLVAIPTMAIHLREFTDMALVNATPRWEGMMPERAAWVVISVCVGGYLRWQDTERVRAADVARRMQRLALAQDLHDFVAHDLSGMVVQAQAAQVSVPDDDGQLRDALHRIEQSGLHALAAMDRTVRMLHEFGAPAGGGLALAERVPGASIAELPALTERFTATGPVPVVLDIAGGADGDVPTEVGATVYRIVAEALTNVRRHAPHASLVRVRVDRDGEALRLAVTDDAAGQAVTGTAERRGGFGLSALAERVTALGGTFEAGPNPDGGWRVRAVLPLDREP